MTRKFTYEKLLEAKNIAVNINCVEQNEENFIFDVPLNFKTLRKECGYNKKECAAFLRVNEKTVRRWEKGESEIPWSAFLALMYCKRFCEI